MMHKQPIAIANLGSRSLVLVIVLMQLVIIADIAVFSDSTHYQYKQLGLICSYRTLIVLSGLFCLGTCIIFYKWQHRRKFQVRAPILRFVIVASILLLVLQIYVSLRTYFYTDWDAGFVRQVVEKLIKYPEINDASPDWYYSRYPNNIVLTGIFVILERAFIKLGMAGYTGLLITGDLLVNAAGVFVFLVTRIITKRDSYATLSWLLYVFLIGLSPWIWIPYSDTYSILFPILAVYLYVAEMPANMSHVKWFLIGFVCLFGYLIKPPTVLALVAILVIELLRAFPGFQWSSLKRQLASVAFLLLAVMPVLWIQAGAANLLGIAIDKNQQFTMLHYAMMGLNKESDGIFSPDDVGLSAGMPTVAERNRADLEVIRKRLYAFGVSGYLRFLGKKALVNFADGSFGWGNEGFFYAEMPKREGRMARFLSNWFYAGGQWYSLFLTSAQFVWFFVLFATLGTCFLMKNPEYKTLALLLTILGISVFVMLFEARARYLYSFAPLYVVAAAIGLQYCGLQWDAWKARRSATTIMTDGR